MKISEIAYIGEKWNFYEYAAFGTFFGVHNFLEGMGGNGLSPHDPADQWGQEQAVIAVINDTVTVVEIKITYECNFKPGTAKQFLYIFILIYLNVYVFFLSNATNKLQIRN